MVALVGDVALQDTIEVAWAVVDAKLGINQDEVHRLIAKEQQDDWAAFEASVEARKKERGQS